MSKPIFDIWVSRHGHGYVGQIIFDGEVAYFARGKDEEEVKRKLREGFVQGEKRK